MTKKPGDSPLPNGETGRDERGRFAKGNPGGPGNPLAQKATEMRQAAMDAIGPEHVGAILRKVARKALEGDLRAARIVLDRVLGRPREEADIAAPIDIKLPDLRTAAVISSGGEPHPANRSLGRKQPEWRRIRGKVSSSHTFRGTPI